VFSKIKSISIFKNEKLLLIALLLIVTALYVWNLSMNGYANSYYAAAVQSATKSWHAFFYAGLDSNGFISIDKPPLAIWIMAIFTRLLGFSNFAMLLPNVLAGLITVYLIYAIVRRHFSSFCALFSAAIMALVPVSSLIFRYNNPDSFLVLFLVASLYAFMRSLEKNHWRWIILSSIFVGLAFNVKMLQALIVLPVYFIIYLFFAKPLLKKRIAHLSIAFISVIFVSFLWPLMVYLTPMASRPYIGGTTDNNIWSLIFGYNGLSRLVGGANQIGSMSGYGGQAGILRMFNGDFGLAIAWLLPAALISLVILVWNYRYNLRHDLKRALVLTAGGWLVVYSLIFSLTAGTIHAYYSIIIVPVLAILIGVGIPALWRSYKSKTHEQWCLPLAIILCAATELIILGSDPGWLPALRWIIFFGSLISACLLIINLVKPNRRLRDMAVGASFVLIFGGMFLYSINTVSTAHSGQIPTVAPLLMNSDPLVLSNTAKQYLISEHRTQTWIAATVYAENAATIQLATDLPVMSIGGFRGTDKAMTYIKFRQIVTDGKIPFFVLGRRDVFDEKSEIGQIIDWVTKNFKKIPEVSDSDFIIFDLSAVRL